MLRRAVTMLHKKPVHVVTAEFEKAWPRGTFLSHNTFKAGFSFNMHCMHILRTFCQAIGGSQKKEIALYLSRDPIVCLTWDYLNSFPSHNLNLCHDITLLQSNFCKSVQTDRVSKDNKKMPGIFLACFTLFTFSSSDLIWLCLTFNRMHCCWLSEKLPSFRCVVLPMRRRFPPKWNARLSFSA